MAADNNITLGKSGENIAARFLRKNGYKILDANFRTKIGEIDIVAQEQGYICFIEVKTRQGTSFGCPEEAITPRKIRKLSQMALWYLKANRLMDQPCRFDVVSIVLAAPDSPQIQLFKDAFRVE